MEIEEPPLLTVDDKIVGKIEPDLNSFAISGLDEVWMNVNKRFIITASPKFPPPEGWEQKGLGGLWNVRIVYNIEGFIPTPVKVVRFGPDSAYFEYLPTLQGKWKIFLDISGVPVPGTPFEFIVQWGSTSQINKWSNIGAFLRGDSSSTTLSSIKAMEVLFDELSNEFSPKALDYRKNILRVCSNLPKETPGIEEIIKNISRCILVISQGSILDDFPDISSILVCHNSWMSWPKESGYQSKLINRLNEKDSKMVLERTTKFGSSRLNYGSTLIIPVSNISLPGRPIQPKHLVNTVTVLFKNRDSIGKSNVQYTKEGELRRALFLAFSDIERKGISSVAIPSVISKAYFSGGKNDEIIVSAVKDWISGQTSPLPGPTGKLETVCIVQKLNTPKVPKKRRAFGSVRRRSSPSLVGQT